MEHTVYVRATALYLPICLAIFAARIRRQPPRQLAACLLSFLWTLPSLLALQCVNQRMHCWSYAGTVPQWREMPLELYLGWTVLWGLVPQLAWPRLALWKVMLVMVAVDLLAMPLCWPVVVLGHRWLIGEAGAVVLVLTPALAIARWTLDATHLRLRVLLQVVIAAGLFLFLMPELVFALRPNAGWNVLLQMPSWQKQLWLQIVLILAIPGVSAVMEFAQRGGGTPIPYDPPKRLVTSGMYRFVANPMQLSCVAVMLAWAVMLRNVWLLLPPLVAIVYSAGIAEWDEADDLGWRFGPAWLSYRRSVRNWRPRWRPHHCGPPARLYLASTCGPCSEVRLWFEARHPIGLIIASAETLPSGSIQRMRYDPGPDSGDSNGAAEGVRAFARGLEHLNLAWAIAGAALRLPGCWQFVQLMMDAGGLGPRLIPSLNSQGERSPRS